MSVHHLYVRHLNYPVVHLPVSRSADAVTFCIIQLMLKRAHGSTRMHLASLSLLAQGVLIAGTVLVVLCVDPGEAAQAGSLATLALAQRLLRPKKLPQPRLQP